MVGGHSVSSAVHFKLPQKKSGCMYALMVMPWLLCLLTSSPTWSPLSKSVDLEKTESLWWNPVESFTSEEHESFRIHEGDILLSSVSSKGNTKNAIKSKSYLWENGIVPYELGDEFSYDEKNLISEAMTVLEKNSCIKFKGKENETTYIKFQKKKSGCFAPIGRLPGNEGPLTVNLQAPECFRQIGIIEHELLHVVGLFHEQSRPDRDEHVNVHWCNVDPLHFMDFRKGSDFEMVTYDIPYDFSSIMHYPRLAFSRNGLPTITAKNDPDMKLGQWEGPSEADIQKVIKMYNCNADLEKKETLESPQKKRKLIGK